MDLPELAVTCLQFDIQRSCNVQKYMSCHQEHLIHHQQVTLLDMHAVPWRFVALTRLYVFIGMHGLWAACHHRPELV